MTVQILPMHYISFIHIYQSHSVNYFINFLLWIICHRNFTLLFKYIENELGFYKHFTFMMLLTIIYNECGHLQQIIK
jgi:hypothetical protein